MNGHKSISKRSSIILAPSVTYQHVVVDLLILGRQFLPGLFEPPHGAMTEARDDVEEGVEVLALLAVAWRLERGISPCKSADCDELAKLKQDMF